ncbi:pyocin knob domain-containing S74 family peptidase [Klebsiella pneumoniae]|uniref:pyocin knob domain-containing S74 family peptidase n=1 Tax=Klebsiella pneumoniae TaxID=573 RepID=UPI001E397353|nr:pyocin knob domain-containing S74 family peptidase [Klebsiella pneumoniae]MCD1495393.1 pyocin knob domain-containing S74 family peptidase [Klebsiella pneumoniae]
MAIYRKGQASMDAQGYITGYGTKWRENLTLIRAGATIMFLTNPVKLGVITEVVSDTSIRAITTGGAVVARTDYVILLHDSLTVDGLAQDVAETLRYYQGKESEFSHFIEFLRGFDFAKLEDLTNQAKDAAAKAKTSETNAKASEGKAKTSETNAKNSENAAAASKNAAKTSQDAAKASENAALASKNAAAASQTAAKASENAAAASKNAAATSAANAEGSEVAAAASEAAAEASKNAAKNSENAAKASQSAAKTSENNAASSKTAAANSASAAKTSETNAKNSENKAKEYADQVSRVASPLPQYNWPVGTAANERFVKIAKLTDPGSSDCHVTLMITNGGNYGARQGSIDFLDASARGLGNTTITASNVRQFMQIRRIGDPSLAEDNQMRYGVVKGDGFFEIWAYQRAFINNVKVAILAKAGRVDLYVPTGAVTQAEAPDGWVKSVAIRVYDEVNKPSRSDLGLANVMEIGAFGLGGSGISHSDITSNADLMQRMKEKGGHFWRSSQKSGTTSNVMSHGSGIFSRCGDTNSAINIDYASGKVVILAANDASLAAGNVKVNTLYGTANKPSKSDVGLSNVTNDAQVKKVGDTMTGDLDIAKGTPSIRLKSASGNAHLWFTNADGKERGVIWSPENTASLGEIRIRAKTTGGTTGGDVVIRHDGRLEARDVKAAYRVSGQSLALANTDTNAAASTIAVSGKQHTPIMLTRDADSNLSIGFKLNNMNAKLLGIDNEGDISFGENADQKQNSKIVTRKMMDAGFSVAGLMSFTNGFAGVWEAKNISDQKVDLNSLTIKKGDPGTVYVYQCLSSGGGNNITNKPGGVTGNFILYVESIRKVSETDFTNRQRLFSSESNREFMRVCNNGTWSAWRESIVSGMNQDVSVKTLSASGRLSGGELAVGGNADFNGNIGIGGAKGASISDKGIVIGLGSTLRESTNGGLILTGSGKTDRKISLRPAGQGATKNAIEISCTASGADVGDTHVLFGQGARLRANEAGALIVSTKAGQMMYLRPNGDANGAGQVTIAGSGNMVVDGVVESKGLTARSGQITTSDGGIELFHATPYVDFHFNKSSKDYTARIINDAEDQLTFDCRSVRTLNDFTAHGLIRACHNDAFVAWPINDPTGGQGAILKAPSFISRFNAKGGGARCALWMEENVGYEHRGVIEVSGFGGTTQYWQFKANGKISSTTHGDVVFAGLSDINYKDNVVAYDGLQSLKNIKAMNLVKFTYKDDDQKRERRGVIAQQVREIDPCYVKESDVSYQDENGNVVDNKRLVLDTNPLLMDALCAIKALSAQVDELKEEIRKLKGE